MDLVKERVDGFLRGAGLHEGCFELGPEVRRVLLEMEAGLSGGGSLAMLPTFLDPLGRGGAVRDGWAVAIDAGGTNLRVALVEFAGGGGGVVRRVLKRGIPGLSGAVSKEAFFDVVAGMVGEVLQHLPSANAQNGIRVGFCFSFPCGIGADLDGRIIQFNKEVEVVGGEGALLGVELNAALARAGLPPVRVVALNDSAAALLGSRGDVGVVFGTGVNVCYYERSLGMLVNTEMGGYAGFARSACDLEVDGESAEPGDHLFEKMASGAYFAKVAQKAVGLAVREGVLGAGCLEWAEGVDSRGIDEFLVEMEEGRGIENGELRIENLKVKVKGEGGDLMGLYWVLDGLYERAAKLLAVVVAAGAIKGGKGRERVLVCVEGSMFRKGHRFAERFGRFLSEALGEGGYELVLGEDSVVIGSAAAALL